MSAPQKFACKSAAAAEWLTTPPGQRLLLAEKAALQAALDSVFGDQLVQIGQWGGDCFRGLARTRRHLVLADTPGEGTSAITRLEDLAVAADSVDAVLLPHALEMTENPHAVLREVDRILRPDGHIVSLLFCHRTFYRHWAGLEGVVLRRLIGGRWMSLVPLKERCGK